MEARVEAAAGEEEMIKTYRGILNEGGGAGEQVHLRLGTIKGKVGYRIIKFQGMNTEPGQQNYEATLKIFKSSQAANNNTVDFSDSDLLGVWFGEGTSAAGPASQSVIFDREIFNQDIFITYLDTSSGTKCNYYLELEVIPLDDAGAEYTTLKDMRQS